MRGYSELRAISAAELRALYPLACMRVCTTVVMAAHSVKLDPANAEYLTISQVSSRTTVVRVARSLREGSRAWQRPPCTPARHRSASKPLRVP